MQFSPAESQQVLTLWALNHFPKEPVHPANGLETRAWENGQLREMSCSNCIGGCCIGINFSNPSLKSMGLIDRNGCIIGNPILPDNVPGYYPGVLLSRQGTLKEIYYRCMTDLLWAERFESNVNVDILGACGQLACDGSCANYMGERPRACYKFEMGGKNCQNCFIDRKSPAAEPVRKVLNATADFLLKLATEIGIKRNPVYYEF
jgi:hypothetical protein